MLSACGLVLHFNFVIVIILCFHALGFQRKALELLVSIRDSLEELKLEKEREASGDAPLPDQVGTLEDLTRLDESLADAVVRQKLVGKQLSHLHYYSGSQTF